MILLFVLFFVSFSLPSPSEEKGACSRHDAHIYKKMGASFPTKFRKYGGLMVSREKYIQKIVKHIGLSETCAACYGDAYICGWDNCFWDCKTDNPSCDACLKEKECIQNCNKCTKFR